jgi:protein-tyrosine phosphatase
VAAKPPEGSGFRRLNWPDCWNTRDLGGLPLDGGVTRSRVLIRSDSLVHLTPDGRDALSAYGVTTVLDLRSRGEILTNPSPFAAAVGVRYVHRELIDDSNMNNIGDSKDMLQRYVHIIDNRPEAFREVFTAIDEAEGGVVFHCFAGKDRTGLVAAMLLSLAGVAPEDVAADYEETDLQLAKQYEVWISEAPPEKQDLFCDELRCPPDRILGVLDHLEKRWGGVASYLERAGMAPSSIDRVATKLA